ncbi:unnamed protein product [Protopolystoma xenopodis]|uniref:Uncharacterized protein n=1 Tax=Protopolystoma xenopodis TaxID=117903 RepID=A0A3S5FC81_9PLAT|nr:unnamed protein product [Protopolystoma xenopodis]
MRVLSICYSLLFKNAQMNASSSASSESSGPLHPFSAYLASLEIKNGVSQVPAAGAITTHLSSIWSTLSAFDFLDISSLIFFTALFYLLAASGPSYLPVAFISSLTPRPAEASPAIRSFYEAVESAISGVFAATLKLAAFYGLYTTLTHNLLGLDLVVIPSGNFF